MLLLVCQLVNGKGQSLRRQHWAPQDEVYVHDCSKRECTHWDRRCELYWKWKADGYIDEHSSLCVRNRTAAKNTATVAMNVQYHLHDGIYSSQLYFVQVHLDLVGILTCNS